MNTRQKIDLAGVAVLLLCVLPLPYGFYMIGRIAVMIIATYLALDYFAHNKTGLALTFTAVAVLFQPFIKFALGREVWVIADVAVAILLIVLAMNRK